MFGVTVWLMSDSELRRLEVLRDLDRQRLTIAAAGPVMGLERRQAFRLLTAFRIEGPRSEFRKACALARCQLPKIGVLVGRLLHDLRLWGCRGDAALARLKERARAARQRSSIHYC
jgi:hypothetical protein